MALPTQPATEAQLEAAARAIIGGAGVQDGPLRGLSMEDFDRATDLANKLIANGYTGMDEDLEMDTGVVDTEDTEALGLDVSDPKAALASLSRRYTGLSSQQQAARQEAEVTRAARFKAAEEAINQQRFGAPTTSQQLAALSQALLSPRRQRGIAGTFANLAPVFGQMATLQTGAEEKRAEALRQLREQYEIADEEFRLAGLEGERKALEPLIRAYGSLAKPKPLQNVGMQVVNGKLVVVRANPDTNELIKEEIGDAPQNLVLIPGVTAGGQPVFRGANGIVNAEGQPVTQFDVKPKPISATEQREIFKTEDLITSGLGSVRTLEEALTLNQQAYEGSLTGWRKTLGQLFSGDDPSYVATENFDNLVTTGALQSMKSIFGANPTEGERKILLDLQAVSSKPRSVRESILRRALDAAKSRISRETQRLESLKRGEYSSRGGSTAGSGRIIRYDSKGNRIK